LTGGDSEEGGGAGGAGLTVKSDPATTVGAAETSGTSVVIAARVEGSSSMAATDAADSVEITNSSFASTPADSTVGTPSAAMTLGSAEADLATVL